MAMAGDDFDLGATQATGLVTGRWAGAFVFAPAGVNLIKAIHKVLGFVTIQRFLVPVKFLGFPALN